MAALSQVLKQIVFFPMQAEIEGQCCEKILQSSGLAMTILNLTEKENSWTVCLKAEDHLDSLNDSLED